MAELSKLKLLTSKPIDVEICKVHHVTINEIDDVGEDVYNKYLNLLLFNKDDVYEEILDDSVAEFEITMTNATYNEEFCKDITEAISFFLKEDVGFFSSERYSFFYLGEIEGGRFITKDVYFSIRDIVRQLNCIEKSTKSKAGNKMAEDFIKEIEAMKKKYKNIIDKNSDRNKVTMADLVSAIAWKGKRSYDEVLNFTIYRLYDALNQIRTIDNYTFTMNGIYAGTIDTSKMKKELEKLNWIKQSD